MKLRMVCRDGSVESYRGWRNHIPAAIMSVLLRRTAVVGGGHTCNELEGHSNALLIVRHFGGGIRAVLCVKGKKRCFVAGRTAEAVVI